MAWNGPTSPQQKALNALEGAFKERATVHLTYTAAVEIVSRTFRRPVPVWYIENALAADVREQARQKKPQRFLKDYGAEKSNPQRGFSYAPMIAAQVAQECASRADEDPKVVCRDLVKKLQFYNFPLLAASLMTKLGYSVPEPRTGYTPGPDIVADRCNNDVLVERVIVEARTGDQQKWATVFATAEKTIRTKQAHRGIVMSNRDEDVNPRDCITFWSLDRVVEEMVQFNVGFNGAGRVDPAFFRNLWLYFAAT